MTTATDEHVVTVIPDQQSDRVRRACSCGWRSLAVPAHIVASPPHPCPRDPTVTSLSTLQFHWGGLFDSEPADNFVHLVRSTASGTPGPTLCGIDRFAKGGPGWSVGGGVSGPNMVHVPCPGCADAARTDFPGLPVHGSVGAKEMAAELGVEVKH